MDTVDIGGDPSFPWISTVVIIGDGDEDARDGSWIFCSLWFEKIELVQKETAVRSYIARKNGFRCGSLFNLAPSMLNT